MALVRCPECERQVSDRAYTCPHCGYPVRPPAGVTLYHAHMRHILRVSMVLGAIGVLAGLAMQLWVVVALGLLAVVVAPLKLRRLPR